MIASPAPAFFETHPRGHVNLMTDTVIANLDINDLRAITRHLVSMTPLNAASFCAAARARLKQTATKATPLSDSSQLFVVDAEAESSEPGPALAPLLARARAYFGSGLGFESLKLLEDVVNATADHEWKPEGAMADSLALVDADISQAIQSCTDALGSGAMEDRTSARLILDGLFDALTSCRIAVEGWGGEFPFDRGLGNLNYLRNTLTV
ncbi:hypothetical protein SISNIDRAFT_452284 [Sistotremastrum niveocremeum HHB9708]|uniref:Uncharacterized protein n=2 Tax=Sistotremastraceae TaxID=3402574 RepID=A0A164X527_9AGAM|nr:hypothetical protein SISNIDRAFT_452284 [Sistotremastrum niveocremeum HHB9708]KZT37905.1 hypothetical protein SISSUDRAFT_1047877 [Sistotremastrum suecicum HHB10207 ss-3]